MEMKILFVGYDLNTGGIQSALINTLKILNKENIEISLLVFDDDGIMREEIPNNIKVIKVNKLLKLSAKPFKYVKKNNNFFTILIRGGITLLSRLLGREKIYSLLFLLQKNNEEYDVAVSYFNDTPRGGLNGGCNQYVLNKCKSNKKVAWIHTDIEKAGFTREQLLKSYELFDYIVNVSSAGKEIFDRIVPEYQYKSKVVYNLFVQEELIEKSQEAIVFNKNDCFNIVTVARMDNYSKRIDRIIKVCSKLKEDKLQKFRWYIIGNGPDLEKNKKMAKEYKVDNIVIFLEEKTNPYPYIQQGDLFVLTSQYEGYPMVVNESLLLSTPVIITNYAAAKEQIRCGIDGWIVENNTYAIYKEVKEKLTEGLSRSMPKVNQALINNEVGKKQLWDIIDEGYNE